MKRFLFLILTALLLVGPTLSLAAPHVTSDAQSPTITRRVADLATLKSITGKSAILGVYVEGRAAPDDGYEGNFYWLAGDQSANSEVLIDTPEGAYVKPTSPGDGSTGVWVRQSSIMRPAEVRWFDADNTGVADSSTAFNVAKSLNRAVHVSQGTYLANIDAASSMVLQGDGVNLTIIKGFANAPVITNSPSSVDIAFLNILDLQIQAHPSHTGFAVDLQGDSGPFTGPRYGRINNVYVISALGQGVKVQRSWSVEVNKLRTATWLTALEIVDGANAISVTGSALAGGLNPASASLTDAVVRLIGSPTEHTAVSISDATTIEGGYAQGIYARNVQGLSITGGYFENEATSVAVSEIEIENCPSAYIVGNRVRMREGVFDFVRDNSDATSKLFSAGGVTVRNNPFTSTTEVMGAFSSIGTAIADNADIGNNTSDWMQFGSRFASIGRTPHQRSSDNLLVMPQNNARFTSSTAQGVFSGDTLLDAWYVQQVEWVVDETYAGGTATTLILEKRSTIDFTADAGTDICTVAELNTPYYEAGYKVQFTTTGTLPAGLSLVTDYFVFPTSNNTFKVATSLANAQAGTAIDITDAGTGTHSSNAIGRITSGATNTPVNGTVGDRILVAVLSDGVTPSYKTGILSNNEFLFGFANGGGAVDMKGHYEVVIKKFTAL